MKRGMKMRSTHLTTGYSACKDKSKSNNNNSNNISINSNTSNIITTQQSSTASLEDKPLNLSSSKVLHTSNQQIIDHFIDKWLGSSSTGNYNKEQNQKSEEKN